MSRLLFVGVALALVGCATPSRQTENLLRAPPQDIPVAVQLDHVPFVAQAEGYCGPATLTMAMQAAGQNVSVEQLGPEVFTPGNKGSLQLDLISASRRHGMLAIPIENLTALLREVASGHPVIVFENLGLSWYPRWHYAIVTGYDLGTQDIILHSGPKQFSREDMYRFEYAWKLAGYWALVILPPGELSTTANELAHVAAAAGLEQAGKLIEAQQAYHNILRRWPGSFSSLIGLGNVTYRTGDAQSAAKYLRQAVKLNPESTVARHNLEVAEKSLKK